MQKKRREESSKDHDSFGLKTVKLHFPAASFAYHPLSDISLCIVFKSNLFNLTCIVSLIILLLSSFSMSERNYEFYSLRCFASIFVSDCFTSRGKRNRKYLLRLSDLFLPLLAR